MAGVRSHIRQKRLAQLQRRDGNICGICKKEIRSGRFTIDHIVPRSKGGRNVLANLQLAHVKCNGLKADQVDFEFSDEMLKVSRIPRKIIQPKIDHGPPDKKATKAMHSYMKKMADMFCTECEFNQ